MKKNWVEYLGPSGPKWKYRMEDGRWFRTRTKPDELKKKEKVILKKDNKK